MLHVSGNRSVVSIKDVPNESVQIGDCPNTLYRYVPPPYDQCFLKGKLQIKPLDAYVSTEDAARRDAQEGRKVHRIPEGDLPSLPMRTIGYNHPVTARDNQEAVVALPSYCLCFSQVASRELAERFKDRRDSRTASCVRVESPQNFINEADSVFRKESQKNGRPVICSFAKPVRYKRGDSTRWPFLAGARDPRLIKAFDPFACEAEFRIIWSVPTIGQLPPLEVQLRDLDKLLSIVPWVDLAERVEFAVACIDDGPGE